MKRSFTILLFAFVGCLAANAQEADMHRFHFGLKAGFNLSGFTNDVGVFDQHSAGYANSRYAGAENFFRFTGQLGITADYPINEDWSFAAELLYNGRGGAYHIANANVYTTDENGNPATAYDNYNFQLDYVEFPLMLQYMVSLGEDNATYLLYGGLSPAVLVKSRTNYDYYTGTGDAGTASSSSDKGVLYHVSNINISPVAGLHIDWNRDQPRMPFVDLRAEYATLPVFDRAQSNGYNLRTGMWTLMVGAGLRF